MNAKIIDKRVKLSESLIFSGDVNSNTVNFEIPKTIGGINLANLKVFIKTLNSLGGHSKVLLESSESGDNLLIAWVLGAEATAVCGQVECQIVFENSDGSVVLNTAPFFITVEKSVSDYGEGVNVSSLSFNKLQNSLNEQSKTILALELQVEELKNLKDSISSVVEENVKKAVSESVESQMSEAIKSYEFSNFYDAVNAISWYDKFKLKVGDVVRFHDFETPHLWVYEVSEYAVEGDGEMTASELVNQISKRGYYQIGYYLFKLATSYTSNSSTESVLPEVSTAQNGYVLTVVNGKWQCQRPISLAVYNSEYE